MKKILTVILVLVVGISSQGHAADALPAGRTINWSYAGVPGGIPPRNQSSDIYTSLAAGSTSAQIQTALDNCPSGKVVVLKAGTYNLNSGLFIRRDGITLRGETAADGSPAAVLNFSSSAGGWGLIDFSKTTYPASPGNVLGISEGLAPGSNAITLSGTPSGLKVGQVLALDQVADNNLVWNQGSQGGGTWGRNGDRTLTQFVRVTGPDSNSDGNIDGPTINFEPPIYSGYWNSSQTPQAYWWGNGTSLTVKLSGLENVEIRRGAGAGGTHNIAMGPADSCWIKNVKSIQCNAAHVRTGWTLNCEIRDSYFTLHDNVGSATYSVWLTYASAMRVENNIMFDTPCALGMMSTTGSVFSFNYGHKFPYTQSYWLPECVMTHGGHCDHNLFEGNIVPSFWADWIHGNASFNVYARNRVTGFEMGKDSSTRPINIEQNQDSLTVIGNVLGTAGYHNDYGSGGNTSIWNVNSDSLGSLLRKGNWNTVQSGIPASESLGADTVSQSYLFLSKPSWFGSLTWPPVDPTLASVVPDTITNPAKYCDDQGKMPNCLTAGDTPVVVYHPADANPQDSQITLNEATSFGACWKTNCTANATLDNASRAGFLWKGSATGAYQYNSGVTCPLCWEIKP